MRKGQDLIEEAAPTTGAASLSFTDN